MYSLAKIGMGMSSLQLDGNVQPLAGPTQWNVKEKDLLCLMGCRQVGWTAQKQPMIWAGQPQGKDMGWTAQKKMGWTAPKEYGLDSPKEMDWIAPKKGYGLDRPKEYGLDSSKERVWAGQPQGKGMGWTVQKNMVWIDPKEYGLDSPKEMGWTATKRIWAG